MEEAAGSCITLVPISQTIWYSTKEYNFGNKKLISYNTFYIARNVPFAYME
jgi:hypothetical protein